MTELITAVEAHDVRFPTSRDLDGSDAMNPEPDYSAAYVVVRTERRREGHGLAFTVGRGNEVAGRRRSGRWRRWSSDCRSTTCSATSAGFARG